ncbi:MAG TPA: efflux RND transporter periplasmic adaptor subunit [Terriglobales bacterium]|nr:efflux RND transporter periplasmic adaptor subunit [Terriglobales bacterium]
MLSNGNKRRALWLAGITVLAAGAAWVYLRGNPWATTASKATGMPATAMSSSPSGPPSSSAPAEERQETEVMIPPQDLERMHLKFAKVSEAVLRVEVRVPGTVQPNAYKQVHVTPLVGGVVMQVAAELGQTVKRGQALAQLFSRDLAEAQTAYVSFNAELEAEHKKLVRTQELVRLGAASRQELEEIEANHQVHAAHVEEARQKLLLLGLDERQVGDVAAGRQASTNITIPSPLDGVVTERSVNLGQVVTSGQELFTVTDLSSVWIEANLLENDFGAVHVGSQATITTPAYAGRQYRGLVDYINPQVDTQTRTAKVRVAVDNPGLVLRLGMYMDVLFTSPAGATVPIVPKQAIQAIGATNVVYLPVEGEPGRFLQRTVEAGEETPGGLGVLAGLKPGETVVTEGSFSLRSESLRQHGQ